MSGPVHTCVRRARAALVLLLAIPAAARAQGHPGDTDPPIVSFSPAAGTVYSAAKTVTIGFCDNAMLFSGTRQVTLNGTALTTTWTTGTKAGCVAYGSVTVALTLQPGANTLFAQVCDGSSNCGSNSAVYTYDAGPDVTAPTVQVTPGSQATSQGSLAVTVTWCDERQLGAARRLVLNGTDVTATWSYATQTPTTSCNVRAISVDTIPVLPGGNTLTAEIQDSAGNWGSQTVTYTYSPLVDISPTNQFSVQPQISDPQLSWSTPAYRSLDADHSVTLVHSSSQAWPTPLVQVDLTDNSADPAPKASIQLMRNGVALGLSYGSTKLYYATGAGTSRLIAWMEMPGWATGSYAVSAVITRYWPDGRTAEQTVPMRVLVVNEGASRFGAGWSVPGVERVVQGEGGIVVAHGDASATFYPAYSTCVVYNGVNNCYYQHSPGDFGTMVYQPDSLRYVRTSVDGTKTYFDAAGQITRVVDRLGNTQSYAWVSGKLTTITDAAGKVTTFGYDAAGKLASITDPAGRVSSFVVNAAGDLATVTGPDQVVALQPTYTDKHRITSYYDRGPRQWLIAYDDFGRLAYTQTPIFTAEGGQSFRQTSYLQSIEMAAVPNWTAGTSANPAPRVNPATLRVTATDPQGRATRFALDPWGAPSRVEGPTGYVSTTTRNAEGQVISAVDAKGNTTTYTWNQGNLVRVKSPTGTVDLGYDTYGNVTTASGATALTLAFYNSATGVLDSAIVSGTDTTRYTYDTRGRVLTVTDPEHHVTSYDYTDLSPWMNTRSVTSGGRTTYYRYDGYGRVLGVTDPDGRETTYQYDVLNRQRFVTTPDAGATEYVWGRIFLDRVNDPRGLAYTWTRNELGWVTSESRPGDTTGVHLSTGYDRYGRPTSITNRLGGVVSVTYDTQDRVVSRTADGQTTTFAFSPDQPTNPTAPSWVAVSNAESTDTVQLDGYGRVTSSVSIRTLAGVPAQRYELQPRYDALNRPVGLVVLQPGAVRDSIGYAYDPLTFRLQSMRDMAGGTTGFAYTRDGLPRQLTLPNTQHITQGYTSLHQPSSIRYDALAIDNATGMEYEYDALGRIQSWIRPNYGRDREFTYSPDGRWLAGYADYVQNGNTHPTCTPDPNYGTVCTDPTAVMTYTGGDSYTYDLGGNPTNHGASVGAGNRLATYDGFTLGYDVDGNLVSKTRTGFTQTLAWNSLGQLASVTTNGVTVSYGYDGLGKRVRRRVNGVDTGYLYAGGNLLLEYDGNGVQGKYTYYPGGDSPHSMRRGGQTYYYATDIQGSVLGLFSSSNTIVNEYRYLPFGESQYASETVSNPIRYAGRELDGTSGLYYNNARWYDVQLHRFVSEDPIGIGGGINLYAYTGNDPVNYTDPSGMYVAPDCVGDYIARGYTLARAIEECKKGGTQLAGVFGTARPSTPPAAGTFGRNGDANAPRPPLATPTPVRAGNGRGGSTPQCRAGGTSKWPRGYGWWIGGSTQAGVVDGVAATGSVAQGTYFSDGRSNTGMFLTGGAVGSALGSAVELPGGVTHHRAFVLGIGLPDVSFGGMITNAQSAVGHKALFDNVNVSMGLINGTFSWDPAGGVWQLNGGLNLHPATISVSRYYTYTVVAPSSGCSGR